MAGVSLAERPRGETRADDEIGRGRFERRGTL
jgi:hypothetical protein